MDMILFVAILATFRVRLKIRGGSVSKVSVYLNSVPAPYDCGIYSADQSTVVRVRVSPAAVHQHSLMYLLSDGHFPLI